jgi:hypothetical protein
MRNLAQYPITLDEKIAVLERLLKRTIEEEDREMVCGSIFGPVLRGAIEDIKRLAEIDKAKADPVETFRQSMEDSRNTRD